MFPHWTQTAFIGAAFTVLMGANGDGCGAVFSGEDSDSGVGEDDPVPCQGEQCNENPCGEGAHLELLCGPGDGEMKEQCTEECVPDGTCPPGTHEEELCFGSMDDPMGGFCETQCVPDSVCPPGTYEQEICSRDMDDPNGAACSVECVPDNTCPPGTHEEEICVGDMEDPMGGFCETQCVPDSVCPEGTHEEEVCYPDPMNPDAMDVICNTECVADSICPEGTREELVCDPDSEDPMGSCVTECVPDDIFCPLGTQPEEFCYPTEPDPSNQDYTSGVICYTECIPPLKECNLVRDNQPIAGKLESFDDNCIGYCDDLFPDIGEPGDSCTRDGEVLKTY